MAKELIKCQVLDDDGKQCNNEAKHSGRYHGDPDTSFIYEEFKWVEIMVCDKHFDVIEGKNIGKKGE